MATLRVFFGGEQVGPQLKRATRRFGDRARSAASKTAQDTADRIVARGRQDIASAPGRWGHRWVDGLQARVTQGGGYYRITVFHKVRYFNVFERGALIKGKPLLWIPLPGSVAATALWSPNGGTGIRARDFPGRLFRTTRKRDGLPLLGSVGDGRMQYFGKEQVTIPKKFHVEEIARSEAQKMRVTFKGNFEAARGG